MSVGILLEFQRPTRSSAEATDRTAVGHTIKILDTTPVSSQAGYEKCFVNRRSAAIVDAIRIRYLRW